MVEPEGQKEKVPLIDGVGFGLTVIVVLADTVLVVAQAALDVNTHATTSPLTSPASVYVLPVETFELFFVHW